MPDTLAPPDTAKPPETSKQTQAYELHLTGLSSRKVASQLGISAYTAWSWIKQGEAKAKSGNDINKISVSASQSQSTIDKSISADASGASFLAGRARADLEALLPDAVETWKRALQGKKVDGQARQAAEKLLKKFGLLTDDGPVQESAYESMTDLQIQGRLAELNPYNIVEASAQGGPLIPAPASAPAASSTETPPAQATEDGTKNTPTAS